MAGGSFPQLFEQRVAQAPDAVALLDPARRLELTYAELDRRANRWAHLLRRHGARPEQRVGLMAGQGAERIAAILAILKAGAAYVPLDPAYPRRRLGLMLDGAGVRLLLADERSRRRIRGLGRRSLEVLGLDPPADGPEHAPPPVPPASAAYVIYTSGSTGVPKGTVVPHSALAWYCRAGAGLYGLSSGDRLLQLASVSFDMSVAEIFPTLASGATLVLPDDQGLGPVAGFFRRCAEQRITVLFLPTALWHELAHGVEAEPQAVPASLRLISFGGERLAAERLAAWRRAVGDRRIRLCNGYGPTEATVEATVFDLTRSPRAGAGGDPAAEAALVGAALDGARVLVLDERLRRCPPGEAGELCIAGGGLARGYLDRPADTARCFVPDPTPGVAGERLYRTGDLGRRRGGDLELLGRIDRQVKIRGFRIEPGEIEACLGRRRGVRDAAVVAREVRSGDRRLTAFVVPEDIRAPVHEAAEASLDAATGLLSSGTAITPRTLRRALAEALPAHLVPAEIVLLDALPWTPNGKVDRAALERLAATRPGEAASPGPGEAASSARETLRRIWCEVLGRDDVGVGDNFFELGGDSILALQVVTRACRQGWWLSHRDLFARPTVAALAAAVDATPRHAAAPPPDTSPGPVPLTPVQRWLLLESGLPEPEHFNQSLLLAVRRPLRLAALRRAVARLAVHHDALRLRFAPHRGRWRQRLTAAVPGARGVPVVQIDLGRLDERRRRRALAAAAARLQASLDLAAGPLFRVAYFSGAERLLIPIHHLIVDGVTWRILLADLESAYLALAAGESPALPSGTTPFKAWAELQARHARSAELRRELPLWLARGRGAAPLPTDLRLAGRNTVASRRTVAAALGRRQTHQLLARLPATYRTRINDALLCALARVLGRWTGSAAVLVDLEGHGREPIAPGLDLARTAGWLTTTFPVDLDLAAALSPAAALKATKERLRAIPRNGIGFGLLHSLAAPSIRRQVRALPPAEVCFNYLGQLDSLLADSSLFTVTDGPRGAERSHRGRRSHVLEVDAAVVAGQLRISWHYSRDLHRRSTIERLAQSYLTELRALITCCLEPRAGGLTPSDVPLAGLGAGELDRLVAGHLARQDPAAEVTARDLEQIYPLSPMQEGMLFQSLLAPETAVYFEQNGWDLAGGPLDAAALRRAWQRLLERHAILRTAFVWKDLERPLQIVHRRCHLPFEVLDWRHLEPAEQAARLQRLEADDRGRPFELERPPLLRLRLLRLDEQRSRLLWSSHHLLLDGWSMATVFEELFAAYAALRRGASWNPPPPRPFRDYIAWHARRDPKPGRRFWRRELAGFTRPTSLTDAPPPRRSGSRSAPSAGRTKHLERLVLSAACSEQLRRLAQGHHLTLGTVLHGAWALLLAADSGHGEVVFGVTVSDRPETLPGADSLVGLLINTLPLRVRVGRRRQLVPWLERLQRRGAAARQHASTPLVDIHAASGVPRRLPLFESLLVLENYPVDTALEGDQRRGHLEISGFSGFSETDFPLTLDVLPGRRLTLTASYDPARFGSAAVERMLKKLRRLLAAMATHPRRRLGELLRSCDLKTAPAARPAATAEPAAGIAPRPVAPRAAQGPVAEILAGIWRRVLDVERVAPEESFFELGGHSLLATRLLSRIHRAFGVELPLRTLFDHPTLAELAAAIAAARYPSEPPRLPQTMRRAPRDRALPLSFAQQRLWFLHQLDPDSPAYHMPVAHRLRGALDAAALAGAWRGMVRRHEILRTTFPAEDGEPRQRIAPASAPRLPVVDLTRLPRTRRDSEQAHLLDAAARQPFDLERGPLLRLLLLRRGRRRHVLFRNLHHIVSDGWSDEILERELSAFYASIRKRRPPSLPELPLQYADFAVQQRRSVAAGALEAGFAYWQQRLSGAPPELALPRDRPRASSARARGGVLERPLAPHLGAALERLGLAAATTPFMVFCAAFTALLRRLTGARDLLLGTPAANRSSRQAEALVGVFVNTLVLRVELPGDPTFEELLCRVRDEVLAAHAHRQVPFDRLVHRLAAERTSDRNPFFQVMFDVEPTAPSPTLAGLTLAPAAIEATAPPCELALSLRHDGKHWWAAVEHDAELYDRTTVQRLLAGYLRLLEELARRPQRRVLAAVLWSPAEEQQALREWGEGPTLPPGASFPELLTARSARQPEALALVDSATGEQLTCRQLARRVDALAHHLAGRGVGPEVRAGVLLEGSAERIVAVLAILAAGGAYVPIEPDTPEARVSALLDDAGATLVLTRGAWARRLGERRLVRLDADLPEPPAGGPPRPPHPEQTAYVMLTSGSGGRPKAVAIPHRALAWYTAAAVEHYALAASDRVLQLSAFGFDISVEEIFPCLARGAALVLRDDTAPLAAEDLFAECRRRAITALFLPTALWHELASSLAADPSLLPPTLRLVAFGGEPVLPRRIADWRRAAPRHPRLMNTYGPTEATVVSTLQELTAARGAALDSTIGRPVPGARARVLDRRLGLSPTGAVGELALGGPGLARGYLGSPAATAASFVPDAWAERPGERLYRTGDLARWRAGGRLELAGRADRQVKIRGFRVEPGEVERRLGEHPAIDRAVVVARGQEADRRLVAYLVPAGQKNHSPSLRQRTEELRPWLQQRLPGYMVPSAFAVLDELPLSPRGKVDLQALPSVPRPAAPLSAEKPAPGSIEETLATIWAEVLGRGQVGLHDSFFALGGDSILALRAVAAARRRGLRLRPRDLFRHRTVAELAAAVGRLPAAAEPPEPVTGPVPLTPIQRWFFDWDPPAPSHFNQSVLLAVRRRLAPGQLAAAVGRLLEHHDALRLRFERNGGGWEQRGVPAGGRPPVTWLDFGHLPRDRRRRAVEEAAARLQASLDLAAGPLVRVAYFDLGGRDDRGHGGGRLLLVVHHLAVDGVSWPILLEDLEDAYRRLERGVAATLPAKTASFRRWAEGLLARARSGSIRGELAYWRRIAARATPLPLDFPHGDDDLAAEDTVPTRLSAAGTRHLLRRVPAASGAAVQDLLLTALARCLTRWSGHPALLLDLEGHGREAALGLDVSRTVGWFTATFPVYLDLAGTGDGTSALARVREQLAAIPSRGLGYGLLRYLNGSDGGARLGSRAQVSFNFLGHIDPSSTRSTLFVPAAESPGPEQGRRGRRTHLLDLNGRIAGGRLEMDWTYSRGRHRRATIERLTGWFIDELEELIARVTAAAGSTSEDGPALRGDDSQP